MITADMGMEDESGAEDEREKTGAEDEEVVG